MVEISNKNNNKVVRVSVGGNSGNNPTIKPNGDYSSYYSELSKAWAIKMDGMVSREDYSSKYYSTQAKANAETTENNLNSVISEHEQITNEITEARENISGDLSGALTDIATARDNGVAKVTETKTNSLSEIESAKTEAEQTITTGLNNFNTNAQAKSDSLQTQFDTSISNIKKQETTSVNAVKTAQSTAETSITELKTSAETSINDTKTSAESSITDIKNTAISDVQNQESTTEVNIDKKVQEALNKIPDIDDKLNISKMYKTGEISTDTTGYKQLVEMKHSTFDKSKFTVVGSSTITEDGVVSGFSSSNYIQTPNVPELGKITESIRFTSSFVYNTISAEQTIWNQSLNFDFRLNNGSIILRTYDGSKANTFSILQSQHKVANGEQVFCDVVITPNLCRIKINGVEYTKEQVTDFSYLINIANKYFNIGMSNAFGLYFQTSIDLKSFSITVDGKEVFSGNKTGIDTVKIGGETVEIPYTQSKTGSKIVDVAYRDKVQALYNQEGRADYYTIDEENQNFTLPMGEIYGMINSIKPSSGKELLEIYIDPFCDESENKGRIANGQIIVQNQFPEATKKLKKRVGWDSENKKATLNTSLVCTEEEWQAIKTTSKLGQCGKFVIDDEAGTIRLPAIVNINGLTDLSKCGLIKDESLPAHKHTRGSMEITGSFSESKLEESEISGSFYYDGEVGFNSQAAGGGGRRIRFSAARTWTGSTSTPDNATYQDNAPVQQEAVQYPYVICVNTGVEEAERPINNYQVNNTNSYGDNKYVGNTILNNLSWLRSVDQENPAGVHQDFFNWAIANIGQPFGAGLIKKSTATDITEYDLVINKSKQTFILPTLNGEENIISAKYSAMNINGSPYNFTAPANGWLYMSGTAVSSNNEYITVYIDKAKTTPIIGRNPLTGASITYLVPVFKGQEVIIEYTASNISRCKFIYAKGNGNLYYYVGDTLQNADLINIARMQEQLVDKANVKDVPHLAMPSDKYIDLTLNTSGSTYTAPADGYVLLRRRYTNNNIYQELVSATDYYGTIIHTGVGGYLGFTLPVRKGSRFLVNYVGTLDTSARNLFRFYYAVGSEPTE